MKHLNLGVYWPTSQNVLVCRVIYQFMHTSAFRGAEPILKAAKLASVAPLLQPPTGLSSSSSLDKNVATIEAK